MKFTTLDSALCWKHRTASQPMSKMEGSSWLSSAAGTPSVLPRHPARVAARREETGVVTQGIFAFDPRRNGRAPSQCLINFSRNQSPRRATDSGFRWIESIDSVFGQIYSLTGAIGAVTLNRNYFDYPSD
jgi:hypothetical protein